MSGVSVILTTPCGTSVTDQTFLSGKLRNYVLFGQYYNRLPNINLTSVFKVYVSTSHQLVFRPQFGLFSQQVVHQRKYTTCSPKGFTSIAQINDHFSKLQHSRILTVGRSTTLIITAVSICSDGFFSFLKAFLKQPLL